MINKPPPLKGLDIRIPILIPVKGRGFINQGSALASAPEHAGAISLRCCAAPPGSLLRRLAWLAARLASWKARWLDSLGHGCHGLLLCNVASSVPSATLWPLCSHGRVRGLCVAVSQNRGTQYRAPNTIVLSIGTSQKGTLNIGKLPCGSVLHGGPYDTPHFSCSTGGLGWLELLRFCPFPWR